jgi:integrase/recombinase XerC
VPLQLWLDERPDWPGAQTSPALLLNRRGTRLTTRGASTIFRTIATTAGLDDRRSFIAAARGGSWQSWSATRS